MAVMSFMPRGVGSSVGPSEIEAGTITNTEINGSAAIAYSKMAATGDLNAAITIGTNTILNDGTDVTVAQGGTGLGTIAAGSVWIADSLDTVTALTSTSGTKVLTNTAGTMTWEVSGAGGANPALDNLASVAINTSLISDTDIEDDLGTGDIRWRDTYTSTVRAGLTAADTVLFQARDVDGASFTTFATLTSANVPTFDLDAAVTIGTNAILDATSTVSALTTVGTLDTGNATAIVDSASLTAEGKIEIATVAETNTGTDAGRAVSPDGLDGWTGSAQVVTLGTVVAGDVDAAVTNASLTAPGKVELATAAETNTGTDATRAVTPDGLDDWTGSTQVTTLGTIASGTWQGTTIAVNQGGTGDTTYTDGQLLIGNTTGNTLTKATITGTSNEIDITNGNGTIEIGIASAYAGGSSIVTVGTIATGTWEATDVAVLHGGTGSSTASGALSNLGGIGAATSDTLTNKTFDANGTGNSLSNVDVADLANGTDGELITWNSSGVATTVPVGTAAQVLTSNGAGAEPTFQAAAGGGGEAFDWIPAHSGKFVSTTDSEFGDYPAANMADNSQQKHKFAGRFATAPSKVEVIMLPEATGDLAYFTVSDFAQIGEAKDLNSDSEFSSGTPGTSTMTASQISAIDVSASFTGATAADFFGFEFAREGADASDTQNADAKLLGLLITY